MKEDLPGRLAINVRQLRQARGSTQQQMAKLASLPRATWSNLESGQANPTLAVLHAASAALGVSLEELFSEIGNRKELAGVTFDRKDATETLKIYLAR